jgi:peroxin-2
MAEIGNPANRVLQLDGYLLDEQVIGILKEKLTDAFSDSSLPLKFQRIGSRHNNELIFLLKLILYKLFVWDKSSTYGLILQNLKLSNNKRTETLTKLGKLFILMQLINSYLNKKLSSFLYSEGFEELQEKNPKLFEILKKLNTSILFFTKTYKVFEILNTITFFTLGDYSSIFNRIFQIRHEKLDDLTVSFASNPQTISYEFQDRQLIWNGLTEFLTNFSNIKMPRFIIKIWKRTIKNKNNNSNYKNLNNNSNNDNGNENDNNSVYKFLPERCCAICYENDLNIDKNIDDNLITNAYVTNCNHVYCYFCLMNEMEKAKINEDDDYEEDQNELRGKWKCLRCNERVIYGEIFTDGMGELKEEVDEYLYSVNKDYETDSEDDGQSDMDVDSDIQNHSDDEEEDEADDNEEQNSSENSEDSDLGDNTDSEDSAYEYDVDLL